MERTLYVTDLDGTLLDQAGRIPPESLEILNRLMARGMLFTYATARSYVSASVVTDGLRVSAPVIVYNGAYILRPDSGEILAREEFSAPEMDFVVRALDSFGVDPLVYAYVDGVERVSWIAGRENDGVRRYLSLRQGDRRLRPVASREELFRGDKFYFTCIGERAALEPVHAFFAQDVRFRCTLQQELYRPEFWCEIMPARATKANAIQKLCRLLGCERIVSFGDAINDIPMFEISQEAYAVANAAGELKAIATGVIGSNDSGAVAQWLAEHTPAQNVF